MKKLAIGALLALAFITFLSGRHASALSNNYPQGIYNSGEWVMLSQYQCPGHCLQTPDAAIRIFYQTSDLDNDFGRGSNPSLGVNVVTDCRYSGRPTGYAQISGSAKNTSWPGVNCTGLNSINGSITNDNQSFSVSRSSLICNNVKFPGWCYADLMLHVDPNAGNQPVIAVWVQANYVKAKVTAKEYSNYSTALGSSDCWSGAGGSCAVQPGGPPTSSPSLALWNNYNNNGPTTHSNWPIRFAPDCSLTGPTTAYLRWYDADNANGGNNGTQEGTLSFTLYENGNPILTRTDSQLGGNDSYREVSFTIRPGANYNWQWNNVSATNGIQVWVPFSELGPSLNCSVNNLRVSCTLSAAPSAPTNGTGVTMTVTLNNSSSSTGPIPSSYQFRQVNPSGGAQMVRAGGIAAGGSQVFTFNLAARSNTTITFQYALFDGSGAGASAVGNNPLCQKQVTWGAGGGGGGSPTVSCTQTVVPGMSTAATYTSTVNWPGGYWTTTAPQPPAVFGSPPHTWASPPPNDSTRGFRPRPVPGNDYLYNPGLGGFTIKYWWVSGGTITVTNPATIVPFYLHFDGSDGSQNDTGVYQANANQPYTFPNSFGAWGFLRPHLSYTVTLYAQRSGSLGANQGGPYGNWSAQGSPVPLQVCLQAHVFSPPQVCGGGTGTTVPIGQSEPISYTLELINLTNQSFAGLGYNILLNPGAGMTVVGSNVANVDIPAGPSGPPVSVTGNYTVIINYNTSFSVTFRYGGQVLNFLPDEGWDGTCQGNDIKGIVQPFFQVWASEVSAGGGFRSPGLNNSGSCGGAGDSPYLSPAWGGGPYTGGIWAFGNQNANKGSRVDFGAIALGINPGAAGGDLGFFSGDSSAGRRAVFANNLGGIFSTNMGGYLNGSPQNHCVNDFYTNTQQTPAVSSGNLQTDIDNCAASCQYNYSSYTIDTASLPAGKQVTLYINHDVTINGNINYTGSFDATSQSNIPYLAIIVKGGNINLSDGVTQLDGLYVAQPNFNTGGVFATCNDVVCNNQLVVNGAVIAQQVQLLRNHGTVNSPGGNPAGINGNPAEVFNFVPSMVAGTPAFAPQDFTIENIFSLPPVF